MSRENKPSPGLPSLCCLLAIACALIYSPWRFPSPLISSVFLHLHCSLFHFSSKKREKSIGRFHFRNLRNIFGVDLFGSPNFLMAAGRYKYAMLFGFAGHGFFFEEAHGVCLYSMRSAGKRREGYGKGIFQRSMFAAQGQGAFRVRAGTTPSRLNLINRDCTAAA